MSAPPAVGVVGLGTMGLGIAQAMAQAGHPVLATDADAGTRAAAPGRLAAAIDALVARGSLAAPERDSILSRLRVVDGPEALGEAALVVEAIIERVEAKRTLFAALDLTEGQLRAVPRPAQREVSELDVVAEEAEGPALAIVLDERAVLQGEPHHDRTGEAVLDRQLRMVCPIGSELVARQSRFVRAFRKASRGLRSR